MTQDLLVGTGQSLLRTERGPAGRSGEDEIHRRPENCMAICCGFFRRGAFNSMATASIAQRGEVGGDIRPGRHGAVGETSGNWKKWIIMPIAPLRSFPRDNGQKAAHQQQQISITGHD